jgi:maltose alpha-D-glucosyltransferase/alpha-amylase
MKGRRSAREALHQGSSWSKTGTIVDLQVECGWEECLEDRHRGALESALAGYLPERRWFRGKTRAIKQVHIEEDLGLPLPSGTAHVLVLRVEYVRGEPDHYLLPLGFASGDMAAHLGQDRPELVVARVQDREGELKGVLLDAVGDREFALELLGVVLRHRSVCNRRVELVGTQMVGVGQTRSESLATMEPALSRAEQSNSSVIFGDRLMLKLFRRLEPGVNPDLDIGRFLAGRRFAHVPTFMGALEFRRSTGAPMSVGVLSAYIPNVRDAWEHALDTLRQYFGRVLSLPEDRSSSVVRRETVVQLARCEIPERTAELIGTYLESARMLGERTAALHEVLAGETEEPDFVPEPFTDHYVRGLFQSMRNLTRQTFHLLEKRLQQVPESLRTDAEWVLNREADLLGKFRALTERPLTVLRIRHHGDFHLGQVLYTGKDFLIVDFEGEPARSLVERRIKRSPLRDVGGMLRSFDYAAHAALFHEMDRGTLPATHLDRAVVWARLWQQWVSATYLRAYCERAGAASFMPATREELRVMLEAYLLEKAVYELGYELNNRPDWLRIPLQGIRQLIGEVL